MTDNTQTYMDKVSPDLKNIFEQATMGFISLDHKTSCLVKANDHFQPPAHVQCKPSSSEFITMHGVTLEEIKTMAEDENVSRIETLIPHITQRP